MTSKILKHGTYRDMDYLVLEIRGEHNNGYVRIPEGHDLYEVNYSNMDIDCHGGLTFSGSFSDEVALGYWIGFDCIHLGDLRKGESESRYVEGATYKTAEYVEAECKKIIDQIKAAEEAGTTVLDLAYVPYYVDSLMTRIAEWGIERGITLENGATAQSQLVKLQEEFDELAEGLKTNDRAMIKDSIGDMYVVLQQIARLSNLTMPLCMEAAWQDIKDRKGQMRQGVFVKQVDIDLIGVDALEASSSAEELRSLIAQAKDSMGD